MPKLRIDMSQKNILRLDTLKQNRKLASRSQALEEIIDEWFQYQKRSDFKQEEQL